MTQKLRCQARKRRFLAKKSIQNRLLPFLYFPTGDVGATMASGKKRLALKPGVSPVFIEYPKPTMEV